MKNINILFLFLTFSALSLSAQTTKPANDPQNIKVVTDREPQYPKGEQELYNYVYFNVKYPEESKKKYVEGEVTLSFDVLRDSSVSNCIIISGVGYGVDEEVKKLVEKIKFAPAIQNGMMIKMNVMMNFPVKAH